MKKTCISKDWIFSSPDISGKQYIDLPHDYSVRIKRSPDAPGGASNGFFGGTRGRYEKFLTFEPAEHTVLDIDGAYMCARIYLNGSLLDMHPHGYTPFLVDLSDKIWAGINNKIEIDVLNLQPSTRWYSGSGIYRDVFLWVGGKVRIEPRDVFIHTESASEEEACVAVNYCISSDTDCEASVNFEILNGCRTVCSVQKTEKLGIGKNNGETTLKIKSPRLWSCDSPELYKLIIRINADGIEEEVSETVFGVRTIHVDAENGLLINGKPVKLRGGCIHHDHGVLGSAEFPAAVRRKLSLLKDAGFNAVRIAHNPPSLALLEACDELGMYVMDEAFDMWNVPKSDLDYSLWFKDWWQRDISYMVLRDRNHPCVISYSIGNEVPERTGQSDGAAWAKRLADEIRKYDCKKPVTSGICDAWPVELSSTPEDYRARFNGEIHSEIGCNGRYLWDPEFSAPLDMVGYNYLYGSYEREPKLYPKHVIWGSETHALNFFHSWAAVMRNRNVIGDFTWTAFDNLGEAGTGRAAWGEDDFVPDILMGEYPWRCCFQGDFDLCGFRRPQSYFREAIWKNSTAPGIFTTHPGHNGDCFSGTGWHWYDVEQTWTFGDEYIGKPVKTDVYTTADETVFILNGEEAGRAVPQYGIATAYIPYEKGELTAISVRNGAEEARFTLKTHGEPYKIRVAPEKGELLSDNRDLCYFRIYIEDENGNLITDAENEVECHVYNGELMGVFGGNPKNEDVYGSNRCHVFGGRAVAIVRCKNISAAVANLKIHVSAPGLKSGACTSVVIKNCRQS